jgi:iron complex transport system ATP-binding protein
LTVIISAEEIKLCYGNRQVLGGLCFSLNPGQITGLVGPNGCGKSTIIKALSRILRTAGGRITVNGRDLKAIPRLELARIIGVVPQIPLLPGAFTAFEVVLMGRNPHLGFFQYEGEIDLKIALGAMKMTRTDNLAGRRIGELSGGEIQSIVIARVLAQQTGAILLDEPTANLDIGRQIEVLDLMRGLCGQGVTIGIALHDLNLASQYCDRVILLNSGSIIAEGSPEEVITEKNIHSVYGRGSIVYEIDGKPVVLPKGPRETGAIEK